MDPLQASPLVKEVVEAAKKLPPFPEVVWKVMPLIKRMAPVKEIEAVIKYDQAITAKVLALSQTAYFSRRRDIETLQDAIVALGDQQLISVIMTACSARYYANDATGYDLREGELWEHSVASALMSEIVGQRLGLEKALTAYTAALLHDIGKTVLNFFIESYFDDIFSLVQDKKMRFIDAEREILGIDHQQLGSLIAQQWQFPPQVVTAIRYHHNPKRATEGRDLAGLMYVVNRMVSAVGIGAGVDGFQQPNEDEMFDELGVTHRMVDEFLMELIEALARTRQFLSN
jgi:putative nucleotidyltransferase with HDIG domain